MCIRIDAGAMSRFDRFDNILTRKFDDDLAILRDNNIISGATF